MSPSNFAATSTDSDDTAASTAQVPAWAFVIAWSAEEPYRAGEVAVLPPFQNVLVGRGDQELEKFVRFGIQRPGEPFAPSPRPGRELRLPLPTARRVETTLLHAASPARSEHPLEQRLQSALLGDGERAGHRRERSSNLGRKPFCQRNPEA